MKKALKSLPPPSADEGYHNLNLPDSSQRVLESGSWKPQRIVIILPAANTIPTRVALALWNLAFPPNNGVYRQLVVNTEVGEAYSQAIAEVVTHPELGKWEYILTVEADNLPPPDGAIRLVRDMEVNPQYACIGGLYWTKGPEGVPQIWGDPKSPELNFRPQVPVPNSIQECCGTGMGFNLWRMSMFKDERLRRPWFVTLKGDEGKGIGTQDLYFWSDARKFGYRCAIDTSIRVGHFDLEGKFGPPNTVW
jgi:hypothetical protein